MPRRTRSQDMLQPTRRDSSFRVQAGPNTRLQAHAWRLLGINLHDVVQISYPWVAMPCFYARGPCALSVRACMRACVRKCLPACLRACVRVPGGLSAQEKLGAANLLVKGRCCHKKMLLCRHSGSVRSQLALQGDSDRCQPWAG